MPLLSIFRRRRQRQQIQQQVAAFEAKADRIIEHVALNAPLWVEKARKRSEEGEQLLAEDKAIRAHLLKQATAEQAAKRAVTMQAALLAAIDQLPEGMKKSSERAKAKFLAGEVGCSIATARRTLKEQRGSG